MRTCSCTHTDLGREGVLLRLGDVDDVQEGLEDGAHRALARVGTGLHRAVHARDLRGGSATHGVRALQWTPRTLHRAPSAPTPTVTRSPGTTASTSSSKAYSRMVWGVSPSGMSSGVSCGAATGHREVTIGDGAPHRSSPAVSARPHLQLDVLLVHEGAAVVHQLQALLGAARGAGGRLVHAAAVITHLPASEGRGEGGGGGGGEVAAAACRHEHSLHRAAHARTSVPAPHAVHR
jgi:hypothetical protein